MKIIKKGENWCAPTFSEVMVECSRCESKLEIEAEDIGEGCQGLYFECPVCFRRNMLKSDIKERYLNWLEYKNKKSRTEEDKKRDKEREERLKRAILGDLGEIARKSE